MTTWVYVGDGHHGATEVTAVQADAIRKAKAAQR